MHIVLKIFYTTWTRGVAYQKQLSGPKLVEVWARGECKNWDSLFNSATVESNNFKFGIQLVLREELPRNNFYDQNWQGSELGEHPKKLEHCIYFWSH